MSSSTCFAFLHSRQTNFDSGIINPLWISSHPLSMVRQEVDGLMKEGTFIQRPGTTYFHIIWGVRRRAPGQSDSTTTLSHRCSVDYRQPTQDPMDTQGRWTDRGKGVWCRHLEDCGSTQWGINTNDHKPAGPNINPNLMFTCRRMLRQPKQCSDASLNTICGRIALKLLQHRQRHSCTCDLRLIRLGRVDLAYNDSAAHRCSDGTLVAEHLLLPGNPLIDWIHLHDALCFCCYFSSGVNRPTRFSSPRPNHDDQGLSGNLRRATHFSPYKGPPQSMFDPKTYLRPIISKFYK